MSRTLNIVVVEDHIDLQDTLVEVLALEGYNVRGFSSAEEFVEQVADLPVDLMLVDLNLPGEDGISLVRRMKESQPDIGIIMVTARTLSNQKAEGYDSGADVYMTKPVALDELTAAIRSLSKRLLKSDDSSVLTLDVARGHLVGLEGQIVTLSPAEISILCALSRALENRLEAWQLMEAIGKSADSYAKSALEILIVRLRKRMTSAGAAPSSIRAIRGWGYQLYVPLRVI
jgi:DNA-binding response OmpR family regulator